MSSVHWKALETQGVAMRPRHPYDFYPTSDEFVMSQLTLVTVKPSWVLDIGMGDGIYGYCVNKRWQDAKIVGVEIRLDAPFMRWYDWNMRGDFMTMKPEPMFDLVIGNPPYKDAERILRHAMKCLRPGGELIFLLRLSFLASMGRYSMFQFEFPPKEITVCSDRPSFTGDGKTDASEYMFAKWVKGYTGETRLNWRLSYPSNQDKYGQYQLKLAM